MGYTKRLRWFIELAPALQLVAHLTYLEVFSGQEAWSAGMRLYGYEGRSYDTVNGSEQDFMTPEGFLLVIATAMAMHRGSIFLGACPCHSWIWLSRGGTLRHLDIFGDTGQAMIRCQNALVARMVYVLILLIKRGVYWIIEQPATSILFEHPRWRNLERRFKPVIKKVRLDLGVWTLECQKHDPRRHGALPGQAPQPPADSWGP